MKKQVGGLNKSLLKYIFIILFFSNTSYASQIYDYQTEKFIEKLNSEILSVNSYNKKINFVIIHDDFPNAFVTEDNTLFISSGLLIHSPDYVSLLAVLAHEIGHIEKYHVAKRKNEIKSLRKFNSIGNLFSIVGSMIIQEPHLINALVVNQTTINNLYLNFSQEQEIEADIYAVETLNKLNLPKESVKEFLKILEDKTEFNLIDKELRKFSTHPLFKDRQEILESNINLDSEYFNQNYQTEFNFIKSKFIAYTGNNIKNDIGEDEKIYYYAIVNALSGKLLESLKKLNFLINKYYNNEFLVETKADILLSYGYSKEAIKFYKKVLIKNPKNNYIKYNIFINSNFYDHNINDLEKIFIESQILINIFPNNQNLLSKYYNLAKILNKKEWVLFFKILLFNKNEFEPRLKELDLNTKDNNLKKIINLYI